MSARPVGTPTLLLVHHSPIIGPAEKQQQVHAPRLADGQVPYLYISLIAPQVDSSLPVTEHMIVAVRQHE